MMRPWKGGTMAWRPSAGILAFGLAALAVTQPAWSDSRHISLVSIGSPSVVTVYTDLIAGLGQSDQAMFGWSGESVTAQVKYQVGWFDDSRSGPIELSRSDIDHAEFVLLCPNPDCPRFGALGVNFDSGTGELTVTSPGMLSGIGFFPGVRDRDHGEQTYDGHGLWWTYDARYQGKTWLESKMLQGVVIVPKPTDQDVALTCTFSDGKIAATKVVLETSNKVALIYGPTGAVAGVWRIDPSADVLSLKGWTGQLVSGVAVDRTTGEINITYSPTVGGGSSRGQCTKRPTTTLF